MGAKQHDSHHGTNDSLVQQPRAMHGVKHILQQSPVHHEQAFADMLQKPTVRRLQDQQKDRSQWERERQALEEQVACVRAEWQGKWNMAVADIHSHQQATAQTADQLQQTQQ